jgi:hypothetical protein
MATSHGEVTSEAGSRREILEMLRSGMDDLSETIAITEPTTLDEERLQLRRYHELGYLTDQYRKLMRDTELDEIQERLEIFEAESEFGEE